MINTKGKDRLFSFLFGHADNRRWTLELYNAVNGSEYDDPDEIEINTMSDTIYMGMKNDLSFIIRAEMSIWAHQSTYNPNMPLRELMYVGRIYDKYVRQRRANIYGRKLIRLPAPKIVVFYNGLTEAGDEVILNLSDAFFDGVDPGESGNRTEVRNMCITEYDEDYTMSLFKEEAREEGREEGREDGIKAIVALCRKMNGSEIDVIESVVSTYGLTEDEAKVIVKKYW